ncbi:hypothetical protein N657DRAFT_681608 [Parathielavia appendiculata]|uniref:Uncharacterized protein n=1 Tax=Parathielavia appendiculata TaxID=2587402 RepID=A0AAN6TYG9_9PEZI|nr:hypothetical protein N657DRAFT_681608 [Parathielavia appendiculata]
MPKEYFSPYAPRRPRSPRLVLIWVSTFVFILWMTWYIATRHKERAAPYVEEFMHPGRGPRRVQEAGAGSEPGRSWRF